MMGGYTSPPEIQVCQNTNCTTPMAGPRRLLMQQMPLHEPTPARKIQTTKQDMGGQGNYVEQWHRL